MHPEMSKLVHRMYVDLTVYAEISNDEWGSISGFANLVKLHSVKGLPHETSTLQLDFPTCTLASWRPGHISIVRRSHAPGADMQFDHFDILKFHIAPRLCV